MDSIIELCNQNNIIEIRKQLTKDIDLKYNEYEAIKICCKNNYLELFEIYSLSYQWQIF